MNKAKNFHTSLYVPKSLWIKVLITAKQNGTTASALIREILTEKYGASKV